MKHVLMTMIESLMRQADARLDEAKGTFQAASQDMSSDGDAGGQLKKAHRLDHAEHELAMAQEAYEAVRNVVQEIETGVLGWASLDERPSEPKVGTRYTGLGGHEGYS